MRSVVEIETSALPPMRNAYRAEVWRIFIPHEIAEDGVKEIFIQMFEIDAADAMSYIFISNYNIYFYECCHMHYIFLLKVKKTNTTECEYVFNIICD